MLGGENSLWEAGGQLADSRRVTRDPQRVRFTEGGRVAGTGSPPVSRGINDRIAGSTVVVGASGTRSQDDRTGETVQMTHLLKSRIQLTMADFERP